jgi:DNA-binding IclR family transcriptional regulator
MGHVSLKTSPSEEERRPETRIQTFVGRNRTKSEELREQRSNMGKQDPCTLSSNLDTQDFRLPAVDRAMSLFELLANSLQGLTLSELSRKLNMPKSTTHYLIHTLVTRGYVQRGRDGRHYLLGLRLADVASANPAELNLRAQAMPYLKQIAARFNLTATATVQRGAEAVIIAKVESFQDVGGAWVGRHLDLHCTAQGKALISTLSDEKLDRLFSGRDFARFTSRTISSISALKVHLAQVRANGFATNDEEQVPGIRAVAVPVVDGTGAVLAAFSVRGSTGQIAAPRLAMLGREMLFLSREFSQNL